MYLIIQKNIVNYVNIDSPLGNRKYKCLNLLFTNSSSLELCPRHQMILDMYLGPGSILTKPSTSLGNRFARLLK